MAIQQISIFLENKPGMLQSMCKVLAEHQIDMRALSLVETKDFGIARIIVADVISTATVLKDEGFVNRLTPVIAVRIPDEPGGLNRILEIFSRDGVNLEYMYAFLGGKEGRAYMIFRVGENEKEAEASLRAAGIDLVTQEDIAEL